jgi:zinc transporter
MSPPLDCLNNTGYRMPKPSKTSQSFAYTFQPTHYISLSKEKNAAIDQLQSNHTAFWMHLHKPSKTLTQNVCKRFALGKHAQDILLAEEQRPRCVKINSAYILIVHFIDKEDLNAEEEYPSLRFWITPERILSISTGKIPAIHDMQNDIDSFEDLSPIICLASVLEYVSSYLEETVYDLDERLDAIESTIENIEDATLHITEVRQSIASIRRYLIPQRSAIIFLSNKVSIMDDRAQSLFKEVSDNMIRLLESVEMLRERSSIIQDNISNQIGDIANKRMYFLTVIMLIFTPSFFVMGVFSMSMPMPGVNNIDTWWVIILFIIISTAGLLWLFKKKKWI